MEQGAHEQLTAMEQEPPSLGYAQVVKKGWLQKKSPGLLGRLQYSQIEILVYVLDVVFTSQFLTWFLRMAQ